MAADSSMDRNGHKEHPGRSTSRPSNNRRGSRQRAVIGDEPETDGSSDLGGTRSSNAPVTRIDEQFSMGMGAADFNNQQLARLNALMRGEPEEPAPRT